MRIEICPTCGGKIEKPEPITSPEEVHKDKGFVFLTDDPKWKRDKGDKAEDFIVQIGSDGVRRVYRKV